MLKKLFAPISRALEHLNHVDQNRFEDLVKIMRDREVNLRDDGQKLLDLNTFNMLDGGEEELNRFITSFERQMGDVGTFLMVTNSLSGRLLNEEQAGLVVDYYRRAFDYSRDVIEKFKGDAPQDVRDEMISKIEKSMQSKLFHLGRFSVNGSDVPDSFGGSNGDMAAPTNIFDQS